MRNKVNVFIVVSKLGAEYMATGKMRGNCSPRQSSGLYCHVKSHFLYLSPDPMYSVLNLSHYLQFKALTYSCYGIDLSTIFSTFDRDQFAKICLYCQTERLKIKKVVKFDSDLLKKNEDITLQSHTILQTVVWRGASLFLSPHKCL